MVDRCAVDRARELAVPGAQPLVPLADWRARAFPGLLDVLLAPAPGDPADPEDLAALARAGDEDVFPALRHGDLLVFPTTEVWARGKLRGIECPLTDPVSFALLEGRPVARFPELPGWSASDSARRAVAEHRAWLAAGNEARAERLPHWMSPPYHPELVELCGSLNAARAALFAESVERGTPELALTADAVASRWAEVDPASGGIAAAACHELACCRPDRSVPDPRIVHEVRRAVEALPAYRPRRSGCTMG